MFDSASKPVIRFSPQTSRTTPPKTGSAAPVTLERPADGVTGMPYFVADPQHGRDLVGVGRLDDHGVRRRRTALGLADHRSRPTSHGSG